jgi:predicted SnoaL-like aldol condensation-catalyzing enzyme
MTLPYASMSNHLSIHEMQDLNSICVTGFIEKIWNEKKFDLIFDFVHHRFKDHSLPIVGYQNSSALVHYIRAIGKTLHHTTFIENLVCESNMVTVQIKIELHTVNSDLDDTQCYKGFVEGYRFFKLSDQKIVEHWEFIS